MPAPPDGRPGVPAGLLRFVENHDEPRAASVLDPAQHRAVAVATLTQAGARLVHDGQTEGRRTHLPVFLGRFPDEPDDPTWTPSTTRLLEALADPTFHTGAWRLCDDGAGRATIGFDADRGLVLGGRHPLAGRGQPQRPDRRGAWSARLGRPAGATASGCVDPTQDVTYDRDGRRPRRRAVRRAAGLGLAPVPGRAATESQGAADSTRTVRRGVRPARHRRAPPAGRGDRTGRGRPVQRQPLVRVGPVPLRAGLGHRARGLQRRRRRVDVVPARPRQVARLPVERGRDGRALRHPPRALPRAALWNGGDPILKERMFGLTGPQGNHGEDVKEYWWYLEGLPSHALLQWRYHYPQAAFPYQQLVEENGRRGLGTTSSTSCSTPASSTTTASGRSTSPTPRRRRPRCCAASPSRTTAPTRRPSTCCRPCGSATPGAGPSAADVPRPRRSTATPSSSTIRGWPATGSRPLRDRTASRRRRSSATTRPTTARLYGGARSRRTRRTGSTTTSSPAPPRSTPSSTGTKAAWWYHLTVPAGGTAEVRLRLHLPSGRRPEPAGRRRRSTRSLAARRATPTSSTPRIAPRPRRGAHARAPPGRAPDWSGASRCTRTRQQVARRRPGRATATAASHRHGRNADWRHLDSFDVLAMPDPWEYPWFAAWDLAFHAIAWAHLDPAFAKYQLIVLLREWFLHPNGALPAYEWNFDDVNPPVHALAAIRVFVIDGGTDTDFLERVFQKLLLNFTWWLNRQDPDGNNLFGGGFLGLDNISPVDRSHLPAGVRIEQADGTAWMAYYSLAMLVLALLARRGERRLRRHGREVPRAVRPDQRRARGVRSVRPRGRVLLRPPHRRRDGNATPIQVQTLVGVIPVLATVGGAPGPGRTARRAAQAVRPPPRALRERRRAESCRSGERRRATVPSSRSSPRSRLAACWRSCSTRTASSRRTASGRCPTAPRRRTSSPGSRTRSSTTSRPSPRTAMYGGNSNWRGPVWLPTNYLVIRSLLQYDQFFGSDFTARVPDRLRPRAHRPRGRRRPRRPACRIWLPDEAGRRPVNGASGLFADDPAWRDNLLFYEYFHGDIGAGLGATHQTGWTALVVDLILDPPRTRTAGVRPPGG